MGAGEGEGIRGREGEGRGLRGREGEEGTMCRKRQLFLNYLSSSCYSV